MDMLAEEDQLLAAGLARLGGNAAGAASSRLKKNVHEIDVVLSAPLSEADSRVHRALSVEHRIGPDGKEQTVADGSTMIRAVVGGGVARMNPVVVTVTLKAAGPAQTRVKVRGAAKEGLIKQRAGEKTATKVVAALS